MPNWSYNQVEILGPSETINKIVSALNKTRETRDLDDGYSLLRAFIPRPDHVNEDGTWYDWSVDNWGTKWEDNNKVIHVEPNRILMRGETAWSPPITGYATVTKMFPDVAITVGFEEESAEFLGAVTLKNGAVVAEKVFDYNQMPKFDEDNIDRYREEMDDLYDLCWNTVAVTIGAVTKGE